MKNRGEHNTTGKQKNSHTEIQKNPGAAAFYFYKVQFERSADIFL